MPPSDFAEVRVWPEPELPERPYPVLLPYSHPDLFAGREREIAELRALLDREVAVTGVYASSGTGKSSFLRAGLVSGLRREGRAAALDDHPCEPGIARRLLRELVVGEPGEVDDDPRIFLQTLRALRRETSAPPVLVLDQLEDVFRRRGARRARANLGLLIASTAGRRDPPCRWVLGYRREFQGDVMLWLSDVLRDSHLEIDTEESAAGAAIREGLPHDFSIPQRFQIFPLPPLGTPPPGTDATIDAATDVFREVIAKPLAAARYPWRFSDAGLDRLARAFAEARDRRWDAPLAPELQVVLAYLLEQGGEPLQGATPTVEITDDETLTEEALLPPNLQQEILTVQVPEDAGELIDRALEDHLRRALETAFPLSDQAARTRRTRALLALRELADAEGRRGEALSGAALAQAIGDEGAEVLEQMATASTRLVVPVRRDGELSYALSHDRLAELLVRLVDAGDFHGLGVDRELLDLRRFAQLQSELFAAGESESATDLSASQFAKIQENPEALLWGEKRQDWWAACRRRRRAARRKSWLQAGCAAVLLALLSYATWSVTDRRKKIAVQFEALVQGEPASVFVAAHELATTWKKDPGEIRDRLREREQPLDLLERGIVEVESEPREDAVSRIAEIVLPLVAVDAPEDPVRVASYVWALDFFARQDDRSRELRDLALATLREQRPPPPLPAREDPAWAQVPAGTFWMGAAPEENRDKPRMDMEYPRRSVTISAFRIGIHETTNAEFRRLFPDHAAGAADDLPAAQMTWYQAYVYAAWLGGRLPTEAEAEYVRRSGCLTTHCDRNGEETSLDAVAWWMGSAADPESGEIYTRPVGSLEPNPLGIYDLYGNLDEFCADWLADYTPGDQIDPPGPTFPAETYRVLRGGSSWSRRSWSVPSQRGQLTPTSANPGTGFRVALSP